LDEVYIGISHPEMKIKRIIEQKRVLDNTIKQDDLNHMSKLISDM
jgi:hypothetical protein